MRMLWILMLIPIWSQAQPWNARIEATGWLTHTRWREDAGIQQAHESQRLELRPDLYWQNERISLMAKPRMAWSAPGSDSELWLNEGTLGWQSGRASLRGGREVLLWGPSMFWTLSNPMWSSNGRSEPQRELAGHTLLRGEWSIDGRSFLQLMWQADAGHEKTERQQAEERSVIRLESTGDSGSAGLVLSRRAGQSLRFGAYGQYTVNDALLVYADSDLGRREASKAAAGPGSTRLSALAGAAYTFENAVTVNLELFHHGNGLSDDERLLLQTLRAQDPGRSALMDAGVGPEGRHYLALQAMNSSDASLGWNLRLTHNADDRSGEAVLQLDWDVNDRWQLWGSTVTTWGDSGTKYRRLFDHVLSVGVTHYLR